MVTDSQIKQCNWSNLYVAVTITVMESVCGRLYPHHSIFEGDASYISSWQSDRNDQ